MSFIRTLVSKILWYIREIRLCFKMGTGVESSLRLAADTLRFHIANGFKIRQHSAKEAAKCYRVRLGDQHIDLWLRPYGGDVFVFHEVFLGGFYWVPPIFREDVDTIVDLGACIGLTTLYFAQYFPTARFVCVEPNPANVTILKRNVSSLGARVQVIEGAVSGYSGKVTFDDSGCSWGGHLSGGQHSERLVPCYTMERIIQLSNLRKIDILKVDVEGAENRLFKNRRDWLEKVSMIIVELHGIYSIKEFEEDIAAMGFGVIPPSSTYGNRMVFAVHRDQFRIEVSGS